MSSKSQRMRSEWEILLDLLSATAKDKNTKKTRIMQSAYLQWKNFDKYFTYMIEKGLVEKNNSDEGNYELTEKGDELLGILNKVDKILKK
ncbi:MAG TPA: winged helix-turn-helix domain-containing protein [archaeon]|nr:winged helix-turn-helix domain-containing protein [archaeon]